MSDDTIVQIASDVGYIKGKVEGIETDVTSIKKRLEDGNREFGALSQELKDHGNNPSAHHTHPKIVVKGNPGTTSKIKEYKWKLLLIIASTVSVIVIAIFASNGG